MKRVMIAMVLTGLTIGCQKVPLTGRSQLKLVSNSELLPLSFSNYKGVLDTSSVVRTSGDAQMVQRVGNRLRQAMEQYLNANNLGSRLEGFQWEFNLIQSPQVNAWCMPGGKVAFYTGILPYTQNEAGAAAVMGHEISHAIAEHGNERMSEGLLANGLLQGGQIITGTAAQNSRSQVNSLLLQSVGAALPVAYQVGRALPHSRKQESEADRLGLIFMAMAGYNPQEAISFWGRMAKAGGGGSKPPEFLSTHPSDERRIKDLQSLLPEAMKYYKRG
ncbi:M48 family metallopeptidase [Spirosoma utsteinense]|uniref:Zn-dependent protease n=1 Tax=Spirosoma utsteinense TaxID=2585773 RepID=A0ABR6W232_9BACT|nr:M48 family metallopeptidase [Spirosoma utsteinense]MBC3785150.1 putative Zn-dependent protease [Spirosoma utsteinense]MBC3790625.1 putative Zn-dependent protease [Spirosoma utsteinense]